MKTIYLKAEVADENILGNQTGIKIGNESFTYYVNKKELEQAQVLAVEEVLERLAEDESLVIYKKGHGSIVIKERAYEVNDFDSLKELTSLVRSKERTLVEQFEEETKNTAWINSDVYPNGKIHTQEYVKWLEEQLLKKTKKL